jgi:hypothetical protein
MKTKFAFSILVLLFAAGFTFFLLPSCDKVQEVTNIKVKFALPDRTFTIDSISHLKTEQNLFSQTFTANIDSIIGANEGLLGNVSFYQLQLTVLSPAWVTLDWINSARVTITPAGGTPIEVATTAAIDPLARTVNFEVKNLDVAANVTGPFVLDVYGDLSGPIPTGSVQMLLESGIEVTVNPLAGK